MKYMTFWYSVHDDTRYSLRTSVNSDPSDCAVEAAEDYHHNHDGWEANWPLEITLYSTEDGPAVHLFEVERETVPEFYAHKRELGDDPSLPTGAQP